MLIDLLRLGSDAWLIGVLGAVIWFIIDGFDATSRREWSAVAVMAPAIAAAGWLALSDIWQVSGRLLPGLGLGG